ncbi:MAG: arylesterase, partial [Bradyrhizobium sp.]
MARSYGTSFTAVEGKRRMFVHMIVLVLALSATTAVSVRATAAAKPVSMVVLGDSLSAGLGLPADAAFPERLEKALKN